MPDRVTKNSAVPARINRFIRPRASVARRLEEGVVQEGAPPPPPNTPAANPQNQENFPRSNIGPSNSSAEIAQAASSALSAFPGRGRSRGNHLSRAEVDNVIRIILASLTADPRPSDSPPDLVPAFADRHVEYVYDVTLSDPSTVELLDFDEEPAFIEVPELSDDYAEMDHSDWSLAPDVSLAPEGIAKTPENAHHFFFINEALEMVSLPVLLLQSRLANQPPFIAGPPCPTHQRDPGRLRGRSQRRNRRQRHERN